MQLTTGIVGLPNVGKSTLFNALTQAGAESGNFPFCTIDPNVGVVDVRDPRLEQLAEVYQPQKVLPTSFQFVDIAGLVKGASKGEGLGNKFLSHIREVDAIIHVVRCFEDEEITHVSGKVNPQSDMETINLELILSDLETVEKRIDKIRKQKKSGDPLAQIEHEIVDQVRVYLEDEKPARAVPLTEDQRKMIKSLNLLTMKNMLYVANVAADEVAQADENSFVKQVKEIAAREGAQVVVISAAIEAEIVELDPDDRQLFLQDLGIESTGLDRLISTAYRLLGLITYFTAGEKEVRAWAIAQGTKAPQAGGKIHTDFERGFIRAEIVGFADLISSASFSKAKERGLVRLEGKEYVVHDGDIINFRFAV